MRQWKHNLKLLLLLSALIIFSGIVLSISVEARAPSSQTVQPYNLSWNVVANGATTMSSTSYILQGTLGQPVIGESASSSYTLFSGYWADLRTFIFEFFLPTVHGS